MEELFLPSTTTPTIISTTPPKKKQKLSSSSRNNEESTAVSAEPEIEEESKKLATATSTTTQFDRWRQNIIDILDKEPERKGQTASSNPLYIHATRANTILSKCLDEKKAYDFCLHYNELKPSSTTTTTDGEYNMEFQLSLLCHILSDSHVCDGSKVIANGWIYFIMKGLSLGDERLRSVAFLAYQRLVANFSQPKMYRNQDAKLWLHFLNAIRHGIQLMGQPQPRMSHLLATWIIAIWKIIKEPTHPMYLTATHALLAKPVLEMTILPDFVPFYNNGDDNKESRTWLLSVLYCGLRTAEDWKIIQKSPFIKFLCSSFQLEKVSTQRSIIAILTHGTSIPHVVDDFLNKYSMLLWLANIRATNRSLRDEIEQFFYLLREKSASEGDGGSGSENIRIAKNSRNNNSELRSTLFEFVAKRQGWTKSENGCDKSNNTQELAELAILANSEDVEVEERICDDNIEMSEIYTDNNNVDE